MAPLFGKLSDILENLPLTECILGNNPNFPQTGSAFAISVSVFANELMSQKTLLSEQFSGLKTAFILHSRLFWRVSFRYLCNHAAFVRL